MIDAIIIILLSALAVIVGGSMLLVNIAKAKHEAMLRAHRERQLMQSASVSGFRRASARSTGGSSYGSSVGFSDMTPTSYDGDPFRAGWSGDGGMSGGAGASSSWSDSSYDSGSSSCDSGSSSDSSSSCGGGD